MKSLLEPLSPDLVKAYAGEEAGVGLHDIGNALAEAWSVLSVVKACLVKAGNNTEEREKILKEFVKEMGRLVLTRGRGRGGAKGGGRSAASGKTAQLRKPDQQSAR